jgi:ribosomal small subunit protein bTHX
MSVRYLPGQSSIQGDHMGRGDRRTKRGKISSGTTGKFRQPKKKTTVKKATVKKPAK